VTSVIFQRSNGKSAYYRFSEFLADIVRFIN